MGRRIGITRNRLREALGESFERVFWILGDENRLEFNEKHYTVIFTKKPSIIYYDKLTLKASGEITPDNIETITLVSRKYKAITEIFSWVETTKRMLMQMYRLSEKEAMDIIRELKKRNLSNEAIDLIINELRWLISEKTAKELLASNMLKESDIIFKKHGIVLIKAKNNETVFNEYLNLSAGKKYITFYGFSGLSLQEILRLIDHVNIVATKHNVKIKQIFINTYLKHYFEVFAVYFIVENTKRGFLQDLRKFGEWRFKKPHNNLLIAEYWA